MTINTKYDLGTQFYLVVPAPEPGTYRVQPVLVNMININRGEFDESKYVLDHSSILNLRICNGNIVYTDGDYFFKESDIESGVSPVAFLSESTANSYVEKYTNKELEYPYWYYEGEDIDE